jgi:hypothetical protein
MSEAIAHGDAFYARLPEDLLADLLRQTPAITRQVTELLAPALERRGALRAAAQEAKLIGQAPHGTPVTVCAVDGGFAVERTLAVDIAMAVAVGVEGFAPAGAPCAWDDNQYNSFHRVLVHDIDNERLARAAMVCHELAVIADAPHEVCVYDGSHLTPIIQLNSGLSSRSATVSNTSIEVADNVGMVDAIACFISNPQIVGMPKYDSSREVTDRLGRAIGEHIPGDDKYLTSLILQGGEYIIPQRVHGPQWRQLHLATAGGGGEDPLVEALNIALDPLRACNLYYTYWRPTDDAQTYRLEIKPALAENSRALGIVFATLARQVTDPFLREPYPQYLADAMAKSVGLGLSAMHAAAHLSLTRRRPDLADLLMHSYRTEGL